MLVVSAICVIGSLSGLVLAIASKNWDSARRTLVGAISLAVLVVFGFFLWLAASQIGCGPCL